MRSFTSTTGRLVGRIALTLACLLLATPASAQLYCDDSIPNVFLELTPGGTSPSTNACLGIFWCANPPGVPNIAAPMTEVEPHPTNGTFTVRYRFPLNMIGNVQNTNSTGSIEARAKMLWFAGAPQPASGTCNPGVNCNPVGFCGMLGAYTNFDTGSAFIQASNLTCGTLSNLGSYSFSLYRCLGGGSCQRREDSTQVSFNIPALQQALGCPVPPKHNCPENGGGQMCCIGGASPGGGGGGASGGGKGWGPGKTLHYRAGGVGHPGFPGTALWNTTLGRYWSHDFVERIVIDPNPPANDSHVWMLTRYGSFIEYNKSGAGAGAYPTISPADEKRTLTRTAAGWELRGLDGSVQSFGGDGRWLSTVDRNGNATSATYDGSNRLSLVSYPEGVSETYAYTTGKLSSITESGVAGAATRVWSYTWTGNDLARIDRPDGSAYELFYADSRFPGYMTRMDLVASGGGRRVEEAWEYDAQGNVVKTWQGDNSFAGANAVEKYSFSFNNPTVPTVTTVTDPLGKISTYTLANRTFVGEKPKLLSIAGDCPSCGSGPNSSYTYGDAANPLRPTTKVDGRGTLTTFTYDGNGKMLSRTEADGTPLERTTSWTYSATFPEFVTRVEMPSVSGAGVRRTEMSYDGEGNLVANTEEGSENGSAFSYTTTFSYNGEGMVISTDPPGYGSSDVTSYTYDPARGNRMVLTRTKPLVGTTSYDYDAFNQITRITPPNGVPTEKEYDALDRLVLLRQVGDATLSDLVTVHTYNGFGELARTTLPRGNVSDYTYDTAGRMIATERRVSSTTPGERLLYTLNGASQRVQEERQRWDGSAWVTEFSTEFLYSSRCHLDKVVNPDGSATEYAYDCEGNLERMWDANHPSANQTHPPTELMAYDVLNRLQSSAQPWVGAGAGSTVSSYGYDVQDHLIRVTDAEGAVTRYEYSDRDLKTREISEVRGTTSWVYNEHAQALSETDARGVTVLTTYDPIDRLLLADFPDNTLDVQYVYDDPAVPYSKGRLTAIQRSGGTVAYAFDRFGRMTKDGALTFTHDANGNMSSVQYPGGMKAESSHDFADRPSSLQIRDTSGTVTSIVSSVSYKAMGPATQLTLGNGLTESRSYDQRFFATGIEVLGRLDWAYTTDALGNVTSISDALAPSASRTFAYQDYAYYLTQATGPWGALAWTYDKIGNRLTELRDGLTTSYSYSPNAAGGHSSRLASIAESGAPAPSQLFYDAIGDLTTVSMSNDRLRYSFDGARRLSQVRRDAPAAQTTLETLRYDGRSLLIEATRSALPGAGSLLQLSAPTYGSDGLLHQRVTSSRPGPGSPRNQPRIDNDTIILNFVGRPVAQVETIVTTPPGGAPSTTRSVTFLTTDALGTPVLATDASGATRWSGGFEPFGRDWQAGTGQDASDNGIFLRLPGQWVDDAWGESSAQGALYYNAHRWFDPDLGRYTRPDPVGIRSHANLYLYAAGNPLFYTDPLGLYLPFIHGNLAWSGAIDSCLKKEAGEIKKLTAGVDDLPGSQLPENSHMHSMCPPGVSPEQGGARTKQYVEDELAKCTLDGLAKALHALQDGIAPGHRGCQVWHGMPWEEGGESWGSAAAHMLGDSAVLDDDAFKTTSDTIKEWCKKCRCAAEPM